MSDTTTITAEERAEMRAHFERKYTDPCREAEYGRTACLRLLNALEQAEAQLAAALQVNAARQAAVTADVLNAMMAGITGQKESVRVEVEGLRCPYCNEISKTIEAATAHDAECPKHPAVIRAEQAEADVARLTKERGWLANKLIDCPPKFTNCAVDCAECRIEAARRAVADAESEG